eukprot:5118354-Pleurochrysis_carterae.AAC.3
MLHAEWRVLATRTCMFGKTYLYALSCEPDARQSVPRNRIGPLSDLLAEEESKLSRRCLKHTVNGAA